MYSLLTELVAYYIGVVHKKNSFYVFNSWNFVNSYFYLFFFLGIIKNSYKRNLIKILILVYTLISILDIVFFTDFLTKSLNNNIIIASFILVITIVIYYSELLQNDIILNLKYSIFFWISIGVLFFNIGFIPVIVFAEYISYSGVFRYITIALNIIMNLCFIIGFIVSKKQYNI